MQIWAALFTEVFVRHIGLRLHASTTGVLLNLASLAPNDFGSEVMLLEVCVVILMVFAFAYATPDWVFK